MILFSQKMPLRIYGIMMILSAMTVMADGLIMLVYAQAKEEKKAH